jgi:vitamin B12 transporter
MKSLLVGVLFLCICLIPVYTEDTETAISKDVSEEWFNEDILFLEDEGITVTASPETTQQKATVSREEIAKHHAPDMAALLQEILDLGVTRYGAYGNDTSINLRGFDSERIAFLVDGVPVSSPQNSEFDINQIDPASIERIEVIYGGADTKYTVSGALGGVINIITVKKQEPGLRIGGSVSNAATLPGKYRKRDGSTGEPHWEDLADTQNISFSAAYGAEEYSLSANIFANRAQNHFLFTDDNNRIRRKDNNEVWDSGLRLAFVRELDDYAKLILSGDAYYGDKNVPTSGFSSLAGKQKDFSTTQNIMFDMPRAFRDSLAAEASITHSWYDREFAPPEGAPSRHDEHLVTAINRWSWHLAEKLTIRAGGDYRLSYLDSIDMGIRIRHDGGLYLTAEYQPHSSFLVIPSIKGVFSGPGAESPAVAVPKLGLLWQPADFITFKNNYYRSFKQPDFEDLYWSGTYQTQGNPDLKPEDGWGGDLGASYRHDKYLTIGSTFYVQWTDDSIHWSDKSGIWRPENVGKAVFFGSENKIKIKVLLLNLPVEEIGVSLSYQYLLSYLLSYGYTWESEKRIPYMPAHTFGVSVDIPWIAGKQKLAGSIVVSGHYETLRFADTANITKLPPYFLLNINVNQDLSKNIGAFLAVNNVLNTSYESFNDYPMPGLSLRLGMRFNF